MTRKSPTNSARAGVTRRSFAAGAGAAGLLAGTAPFNIGRAQGGPLKIGVILPLSGVQAGIGQSCKRGADIAPALFKQIGYTQPIEIVVVDFETNVDTARARAERLIADGCNMLSGPFDSGAASAIAQVAEQKGVPFVINIAAAPQITEQGYKFVFRNFQTAPQIISRGLALFNDIFTATGKTPKTAVLMHINDTFGQANKAAIDRIFPTMNLPFKIVELDRLRSLHQGSLGRSLQGQGDQCRHPDDGDAAQRRDHSRARNGQAALGTHGHHQPGLARHVRAAVPRYHGQVRGLCDHDRAVGQSEG